MRRDMPVVSGLAGTRCYTLVCLVTPQGLHSGTALCVALSHSRRELSMRPTHQHSSSSQSICKQQALVSALLPMPLIFAAAPFIQHLLRTQASENSAGCEIPYHCDLAGELSRSVGSRCSAETEDIISSEAVHQGGPINYVQQEHRAWKGSAKLEDRAVCR